MGILPPMDRFPTVREAKEYLIGRILVQADKDGISLSDVEKKMLYYSETGWTLPTMMAISTDFDRNYNQDEYEAKIGRVIRRIYDRPEENRDDDNWNEAVHRLRDEDHYLLVLIDGASKSQVNRSPADTLELIVAATFTVAALLTATFVVHSHFGGGAISKGIVAVVFVAVLAFVMLFANRRSRPM